MFDIIVTAINVRWHPEAFAVAIVDSSISTLNHDQKERNKESVIVIERIIVTDYTDTKKTNKNNVKERKKEEK